MNDWGSADAMIAEAVRITSGQRGADYDVPENNFAKIAMVWNGLLDDKLSEPITPGDVARFMIGMKLVRDSHKPKRDNRTDGVGYFRTLERVEPTDGA